MKNQRHIPPRVPWLAVLGVALLGACTSTPKGTYNTVEGSEHSSEVKKFSPNRDLENSIDMRNILQVRKEGMLVVQLELVNKLDRALSFQWGVEWYDRAGMVIDYGPGSYRSERLSGRQSKTIKIVAPSPEADTWKLQVGSRDEVR
jgi:uncharacterized protein YcfL